MEHKKLEGLMSPVEKLARVSARGVMLAQSGQTAPSGAISLDNADGTRTIIGEVVNGEDNPSYTMATHVGDTTPPGVPTGITATSKSGVVVVEWDGTLTDGIPDDFYCIRIYLDGTELGALTEAGSVASAKLEAESTHQVTAKSEDDCCLPDGTPAHNVSDATQAIAVTVDSDTAAIAEAVEEAREIADAAKSEADAHEALIPQIQQSIQDFKAEVDADYYTKTEVDETTGAITSEMRASYRDATARNLSPFFAHDFADVYDADTNPDGYWYNLATTRYVEQLDDGWARASYNNTSSSTQWANFYPMRREWVKPGGTYTFLLEWRNNTLGNKVGCTPSSNEYSQLVLSNEQESIRLEGASGERRWTFHAQEDALDAARHMLLRVYTYAVAGSASEPTIGTVELRASLYEGEYSGAFKPYVTGQDELGRSYVETAKYTVDQTGVQAALTANATNISNVSGSLENYKQLTDGTLDSLQSQLDGQIEAWYYSVEPTLQNEPAKNWTTEELRERHRGDIYYDITTGHSWRWMLDGSTWKWQAIPDSDAAAALAEAQAAMAKAGQKRRIFTSTPVAPYDVNDLWLRNYTETITVGGEQQTSTGPELWYATQLRTGDGSATGEYHEEDWARWIRRSADYSQFANYEFQTDHALSEIGDELWTEESGERTSRISKVEQDAASWKAEVARTYQTKSDSQPNLSPFFAHNLADIYDATDNPGGYFWNDQASSPELGVVGTQLDDGWMHYELDNSARTGYAYVYPYQRPIASLKPSTGYTLLIELRNMVTDAPYSASFRITSQPDDATRISQTVNPNGYDDIYLARGGTFCKALVTKPDMSAVTLFCRQYIALAAGLKASFDLRLSLYETASPEILMDTNAPTLDAVDGPFDRYFSDASNTQVEMTYGAISDPPEELGSDARYGFTADYDGSYNGYRGRSLAFYSGSTSGDARPTFMEAGKQYQATWWARVVSGTAYGRAYFINNGTGNAKQPTGDTALPYTSEWRRYTVSMRPVNPSYARAYFTAAFAANTAGKVELCGFSLQEMDVSFKPYVTGQEDLSKTYATKAALAITDESIRSDVSATYATKGSGNPNLGPFFAHDFEDVYNASTNPNGYWVGNVQRQFGTQLADGWARIIIDNTSGTATLARAVRFGKAIGVKDGGHYTCLVEFRNLLSKPTAASIYTQQGTDVQFWGNHQYDGWTIYWSDVPAVGGTIRKQMKRVAAVTRETTGICCFSMNIQVPAGQEADFEIRVSLYECELDGESKPIPYAGAYKPYVVQDSEITRSTTFEQTIDGLDGRITTTEDGITLLDTLIRLFQGGVLAGYVGNAVSALMNAAGSFDVVQTTWQNDNPTIVDTFASFGANLVEIGKNSASAVIDFCAGKLHMAFSGNTGRVVMPSDYDSSTGTLTHNGGIRLSAGFGDAYSGMQASVLVHTKGSYQDESGTYQLGDGTDKERIVLGSDTIVMLPKGYALDYGTKGFSIIDLVRYLPLFRPNTYAAWAGTTFDPKVHQLVVVTGTTVSSSIEFSVSYGLTFVGVHTVIVSPGDDTGLAGSQLVVVSETPSTTSFKAKKLGGSAGMWRCNWMAIGWVNAAQG